MTEPDILSQHPAVARRQVSPDALSISQGAETLGVDSFTVFRLIQEGRLDPQRTHAGEVMVAKSEVAALTQSPKTR